MYAASRFAVVRGQNLLQTLAPEAQVALLIKDVETGEVLAGLNEHKLLVPASLTKVVTTLTALNLLGEDYQFSTRIYMRGTVRDSILTGDLVVVGAGDPTFGSRYFANTKPEIILHQIKNHLASKGVAKLNGKLIIDTSVIAEPRYPARRLWEDMGNYYGAPPSGLSWRDNSFELDLYSPSLPGKPCQIVATRPHLQGITFSSYLLSANNTQDSAYIFGYPGLSNWEVRGTIPASQKAFTIKGALPNPALQFAEELASGLSSPDENIQIHIQMVNHSMVDVSDANIVTTLYSPNLGEIIRVINRRSQNLMADHLFLALAVHQQPGNDCWAKAANTVVDFWKKQDLVAPVRIYDGSGLSPKNLLTVGFLVDLLIESEKSRFGQTFESSLAIGGQTGTLSHIWNRTQWSGRIKAKSGSMEGVLGYAGYLFTQNNRKLAFCVLINNFSASPAAIRKTIETEIGQIIDKY